ncbi:MAG: dTDP-4-dehydrorhamnose reductase [Candidatus Uhrbacteria bacterium]
MRVLITGSKGTLGQYLIHAFDGHEVVGVDCNELDITDRDAVRSIMSRVRPDCVCNAAAYNAVDAVEEDATIAELVNGTAVGYLAAAAAASGASFVHFSTDYVFDGHAADGYDEYAKPQPVSAYGQSKLLGERAIVNVARTHPEWLWYCIRTSRLFGSAGASSASKRSFVDTMLELAATRDRLEVVDAEVSSPTYAEDLAKETVALAVAAPSTGIYHRTNDGACTWYEFARAVLECVDWKGKLVAVRSDAMQRAAMRPQRSVLITTKLPPLRTWRSAVRAYIASRK